MQSPIRQSKKIAIESALGICDYPILEHESEFSPKQMIGYSADRPTKRADLRRGLGNALKYEAPISTVIGDWKWSENALPDLPKWIQYQI